MVYFLVRLTFPIRESNNRYEYLKQKKSTNLGHQLLLSSELVRSEQSKWLLWSQKSGKTYGICLFIQRVATDSAIHLVLIKDNFSMTGKSIFFVYFFLSPASIYIVWETLEMKQCMGCNGA